MSYFFLFLILKKSIFLNFIFLFFLNFFFAIFKLVSLLSIASTDKSSNLESVNVTNPTLHPTSNNIFFF